MLNHLFFRGRSLSLRQRSIGIGVCVHKSEDDTSVFTRLIVLTDLQMIRPSINEKAMPSYRTRNLNVGRVPFIVETSVDGSEAISGTLRAFASWRVEEARG